MPINKRKICVVVGSRANYSSIKSAMVSIKNHPKLELQLIVGASAILERYGSAVSLIQEDGFNPIAKVHMLIEGETPETMAKSTGLGLIELPTIFAHAKPDVVLTVGDRFETMATTLAAAYMNIPIAHTMGGEVSGTIDESIRHAVTKFAHIHFPASSEARDRIIRLGECEENIFLVGCPRVDLVSEILSSHDKKIDKSIFDHGVGMSFDIEDPFILVSQHPVTTEYGQGEHQITETLSAVAASGFPAIVLWPNADAGSDGVSRGIRKWREFNPISKMHFFKNLPIDTYIRLMNKTLCLVGNSSSGIREGAFIGTPVVNIGSRQNSRERGKNVLDVSHNRKEITEAIRYQSETGKYLSNPIYGDGRAGEKIAETLSKCNFQLQKTISY